MLCTTEEANATTSLKKKKNTEGFEPSLVGANINGIHFFDSIKNHEKERSCHSVSAKLEANSSASCSVTFASLQ